MTKKNLAIGAAIVVVVGVAGYALSSSNLNQGFLRYNKAPSLEKSISQDQLDGCTYTEVPSVYTASNGRSLVTTKKLKICPNKNAIVPAPYTR